MPKDADRGVWAVTLNDLLTPKQRKYLWMGVIGVILATSAGCFAVTYPTLQAINIEEASVHVTMNDGIHVWVAGDCESSPDSYLPTNTNYRRYYKVLGISNPFDSTVIPNSYVVPCVNRVNP